MAKNKQVLLLLLLIAVAIDSGWAEIFYNLVNRHDDPCLVKCKQTPLPLTNQKDMDPDGKYATSCCQRGCRFFNLVNMHRDVDSNNLNISLESCDSSCSEAYTVQQDLLACKIGCAYMGNQRINGPPSLFSIAIHIEDGVRPNIMFMPPEILDNDPLADPNFGKDLLPSWWDSDGFKLPETYFKTVPIDSGTVDYGVSSEYLGGENEKTSSSSSLPGSDWLQCASRHTGIPRWLLAFAIATAALSALWLCLSPEKTTNNDIEKVTLVNPTENPSKITVYLPDEAPLHKKPPPKYSEVVNINDPSLQV